jgi:hypothetical protein
VRYVRNVYTKIKEGIFVESGVINVSVRQVDREKITRGSQSRWRYPSKTLVLDRVGLK